jgi:phage-related protein (TIGR01555 family)
MFFFGRRKRRSVPSRVAETVRKVPFLGRFMGRSDDEGGPQPGADLLLKRMDYAASLLPASPGEFAADDSGGRNSIKGMYQSGGLPISDALLGWYVSQGFIGHHIAALLAQHWLIDKACTMPARDAVRKGYTILSDKGERLPDELVKKIKRIDERFGLNAHMVDFVARGRVFGIRVALFKVDSTNPKFYEYPFNPDGVTPGSYRGIVQLDPYWLSPVLDGASAANPASQYFYEPTWWIIDGKKYHRSHLVIFRNGSVPDILKPSYLYGGVPVPQQIMARVYGAERTTDEALQLAMTKRTTTFATDAAQAFANPGKLHASLSAFVQFRDNYAVKVHDKDSEALQQFDTSLADLDAVIMTQYQLVAAAAGVPATKLIGTTPKGFNSTGEYEEASYHEHLESIQTNDLRPLIERHHMLVMRSEIAPHLADRRPIPTSARWEPLDSPTEKEVAETQKIKAERDDVLIGAGVIDGTESRDRIRNDEASDYYGIGEAIDPATDPEGAGETIVGSDGVDPVRLVSNQKYLDASIVAEKIAARDFVVQVTPMFVDPRGLRYRVVIDGHHSLAAATRAGVAPTLVEGDYAGSDYVVLPDAGA